MKTYRFVFVVIHLSCILCNAQNVNFSNVQTQRKHHFGLGLTTDLFSDVANINSFNANKFFYDELTFLGTKLPYATLEMRDASFYSLYIEYQYAISKRFSASTRLKLNCRNQSWKYMYSDYSPSSDHNMTNAGTWYLALREVEIPVIFSYKIPLGNDVAFWVASLGGGITFHNVKNGINVDGQLYSLDLYYDKIYHLDFELLKKISPFIYIGSGFEFMCNRHKFLITASYTIYPQNVYRWNHWIKGNNINIQFVDSPFSQNNIEVGLVFFW
ncbi:MAG: hypothetical protein LBR17_04360 [Bacteroidales bacterium]|jgi:hypothetical protein|nr:hypothetical protein [Bacteroidales bacterium]